MGIKVQAEVMAAIRETVGKITRCEEVFKDASKKEQELRAMHAKLRGALEGQGAVAMSLAGIKDAKARINIETGEIELPGDENDDKKALDGPGSERRAADETPAGSP